MTQVQSARSFLFVPGDRPERFDKAVASGADVVIIDLEDAVAPEAKATARDAVVQWLTEGGRAAVRVNAVDSPEHQADVHALAGTFTIAPDSELLAVVLPKADDPDQASSVANLT
ncbi:MAG: aldolase/citrate lyase family protein, partial [Micrococcales bacterium]|nr:aldolase/citrate lyase family protein [Micrococcales bacterium]